MKKFRGILKKMKVQYDVPIKYELELNEIIPLNTCIGRSLVINWSGKIFCRNCSKSLKKTFGEGFCFDCFSKVPESSPCIIRPELCRAHLGEGRDVEWEELHHNVSHIVYLAATDNVKVGVTRQTQVPVRWIDQGAGEAITFAQTPNRFEAGRIEVELKSLFTDKTNWQNMLRMDPNPTIDLIAEKWNLYESLPSDLLTYFKDEDDLTKMKYPILNYPQTVKSCSLTASPTISETLIGIKGQYFIFSDGTVFNIRKHTGFEIEMSFLE
jgi:hypothetical protein